MIPYPGSKVRLARTIVSFLPKQGRIYCEPFAGTVEFLSWQRKW